MPRPGINHDPLCGRRANERQLCQRVMVPKQRCIDCPELLRAALLPQGFDFLPHSRRMTSEFRPAATKNRFEAVTVPDEYLGFLGAAAI